MSFIIILFVQGLEQEIDIMETVLHIRNQRFGMVQTEVSELVNTSCMLTVTG